MEFRSVKKEVLTSERRKILEERETLRNEAAKTYGKYLVNMTNMCFDKCINTDEIYLTRSEDKCIDSCFSKYRDINNHALNKFNQINKDINNNISENYITNINDLN
jgi:hypothetical protein